MKDTYYAPVVVSDRFSGWIRHPAVWCFWDAIGSAAAYAARESLMQWIREDRRYTQEFLRNILMGDA